MRHTIFTKTKKVSLPIGCWAHSRRRFEEALKEDKARAEYALGQIGLLYDVERQADQENLSFEERAELRCRLSYPIMVVFEKWMVSQYPKVLPKGRIGKAISYTFGIYHKLTRYHLTVVTRLTTIWEKMPFDPSHWVGKTGSSVETTMRQKTQPSCTPC